jgi:hypothetical protein
MRWDLSVFAGQKISEAGLLELTTYSLNKLMKREKDFGMIRVIEILDGDKAWDQNSVTYNLFIQSNPIDKIINGQMIIDVDVNEQQDGKNIITISKPVLQRMIDGKTLGMVIRPLGPIYVSFYAKENGIDEHAPKLHLNIGTK